MFYLVNEETAAANSLMEKMAEQARPGALIPCTEEELRCFGRDFIPVAINPTESKLIEVDPDKTYMLFADNEMNLDDILAFIDGRKMNIGIVRVGVTSGEVVE